MRIKNTIKNSVVSTTSSIISILIGFVSRAIFIRCLGAEYLGLNGLFSNILTILNFFELGVGSAIVTHLYKPIADNNKEKIKSLMFFYKKAYRIIAIVVLFIGLAILPFIKSIVGEITIEINIYIIYLLFLVNTVSSYLLTYKRNFVYANQQDYILSIINIFYIIVLNVLQLLCLYFTKNYYIYLSLGVICQIVENVIITIIANRLYPFLKEKNINKLDKDTEQDILKKVKALIFHKVGSVFVKGTDNIIISYFLGIITVGYYSNYNTIISIVNSMFSQIISSTSASVGNMIKTESVEKNFETFKKIRFLNFWLATFSSVCLLIITQTFIKVWLSEEYILDILVLMVLVLNYYQKMMRQSYSTFKSAAGIWYEDRFVPLMESLLNIVFSIVCLKIFGLAGVFMGTIISSLAVWCYSYPKYVYKDLLGGTYTNYIKENIGYLFLFIVISIISYLVSSICTVNNDFIHMLINMVIGLIIPNFILFIIFKNTENFKYFFNLINTIMSNIKRKKGNNYNEE